MVNRVDTVSVPTTDIVQDLGQIDAHLAELYRRTAGVEGAGTYVPITRSLLLNLVVFTSGAGQMGEASGVVSEIMGSHPCRSIVVDIGQAGPQGAPASISAVCGISERGDRRLCGEIIEMYAEDPNTDLVGLVMPVLVPDMPVFVWMRDGVKCSSDAFADIMEVTDVVLVDSRRFGDLREEMPGLLEACKSDGYQRSVQDLAWVSLLAWRELVAGHFDPPQAREYLDGLSKVIVRFSRGERGGTLLSVPLLFASWLMERTGLQVTRAEMDDVGGCSLRARQGEREVSIELVADETGHVPGRLLSVSMQAENEAGKASFYIQGISETEVSVTEECVGMCYPPLVMELPDEHDAALVSRALDNRARDRVYEDAVDVACDALYLMNHDV